MVRDYRLAAMLVVVLVVVLLAAACTVSRQVQGPVGSATPEPAMATRIAAAQARVDATRAAAATAAAIVDATAAAQNTATAVAQSVSMAATPSPAAIATSQPAVASTVVPKPATASQPASTATPGGILYVADFATWPAGESGPPISARGSFDASTKSYELALTDPKRGYIYSLDAPNAPRLANFQLDVDARRVGGPDQGSYGVTFRVQAQGPTDKTAARYNFLVHPDTGSVGLTWTDANDVGKVVVPRTTTPAIKKGDGTNHLTVIARGDMVTLIVNGQVVGTYHAEQTEAGAVGLIVINPANAIATTGMAAAFSNFRLSTPSAVGQASSAFATSTAH
jgi:hypothetical protein